MNFAGTCRECIPSSSIETPTVFVVDDDASVREALELFIRCAGWQPKIDAAAEEFLARPRTMTPSCLLAELHLPGLSGLELQKRVFDRSEMPIIFMSHHPDVQATVRAMKAGAFDFLTKPLVSDVLLSAIRHALERSRAALRHLAQMQSLQECFESLSRREREVMALVVSGRMNKQVGGELGISEITVKAHRGRMMRKMQAGSLAELVNIAAHLRRGTPADTADTALLPVERRTRAGAGHPFRQRAALIHAPVEYDVGDIVGRANVLERVAVHDQQVG